MHESDTINPVHTRGATRRIVAATAVSIVSAAALVAAAAVQRDAPDGQGLAYWTDRVQRHGELAALVALMSSDEAVAQANGAP